MTMHRSTDGVKRSAEQTQANDMDCDLYRIMSMAERYGWTDAVEALRKARQPLRIRMHRLDRETTR